MKVLVTGGAGYIGSHTCVELLNRGDEVVVIDNLCNSKDSVVTSIERITDKMVKFYQGDVRDRDLLVKIFTENKLDVVIHFAGLKAVGESVEKPLMYYLNNIDSTISLCQVMGEFGCKKLIFSSSATVYGNPKKLPLTEEMEVGGTTNPYGTSKLFIERILEDLYVSDNEWNITILRYFNPIGAHESGMLGDDPNGIPNNLMPYLVKVALGDLPCLSVFGNDYDTKDGTGVRDYIHVVDLALGHLKAIDKLGEKTGVNIYNLGTGHGYSVMELIDTFERVNQVKVNYKVVERRSGDIAECYASCDKAYRELGWEAKFDLEDMVRSAYLFAKDNR